MTMLWSCPQAECPPTDKPPRDVEEPGEVADGESQDVLSIQELAKLLKVPVSAIYAWNRRAWDRRTTKSAGSSAIGRATRKWLARATSSSPAIGSSDAAGPYRRSDSRDEAYVFMMRGSSALPSLHWPPVLKPCWRLGANYLAGPSASLWRKASPLRHTEAGHRHLEATSGWLESVWP